MRSVFCTVKIDIKVEAPLSPHIVCFDATLHLKYLCLNQHVFLPTLDISEAKQDH